MADGRVQSARAYTLAEVDAMRNALSERWFRKRFPAQADGTRGGGWPSGVREDYVQRELQDAMIGNVDPHDLILECEKTP